MRTILFALALLGFIVAAAPAALVDIGLREASDGRVRLSAPEGTLWRGGGRLASTSGDGRIAPWARFDWHFEPAALGRAGIAWRLSLDDRRAGIVTLSSVGFAIEHIDLDLAMAGLMRAIPQPLAQAGWDGRLRLAGSGFRCNREGRCDGRADLHLDGLRTAILPGANLGDFEAAAVAAGGAIDIRINSDRDNRLRIDGTAGLAPGGEPHAALDIGGDPELMRVLPGVLHGIARPLPDGRLQVAIPRR